MADTETGWTREWPAVRDSFHWMRWIDGRYRDLPVHVNGIQVMSLFDHSYQQRGNIEGQVEFLGPISPSDSEQLIRLRQAAEKALGFMEKWFGEHAARKLPGDEAVIESLRAALEAKQ